MGKSQLGQIFKILAKSPLGRKDASLDERRSAMDSMADMFPALPDIDFESVDADGVNAEWVGSARTDRTRVLLYFHGGGYICGSSKSHRRLLERMAKAIDGWVLAVNYRLAPEYAFPSAVEDGLTSYRWLLNQGVESKSIALAGDSAGGGLSVSTLVSSRDAGYPLPACAVCISPWLDMECLGESMETKAAQDYFVNREAVLESVKIYLQGADPRSPLASPIYADLSGLPPFLIQVGGREVLLDDAKRLEAALKKEDIEVTLEVWDEMIHVWHYFAPILDEGQKAIERMAEFIRSRID